jgi:hypothetical protein
MPAASPASLKHTRPPSGLTGWASAFALLDKVTNDVHRGLLVDVVRGLGVQGAPAMEHAAATALWLTGLGMYRPPRKALKAVEAEYVERRVKEELAKCSPGVFKRMRSLT